MSSATCGVSSSSSSIFGGLCSGNSRRPSMFTAKYRLREERKKVLKMSMAKVKRIEDPESFLRRSVLINNTIKRLQREVREEKMMRHGGYSSKLSCSSFRKSFACSRLSDMHLPDDDSMGLSSPSRPLSRNNNLMNNNNNNNRKRPLSDESEDDCDVHAVLSQIYIPPTPCIISSMDDDDCCDSSSSLDPDSLPTKKAKLSLSSSDASSLLGNDECSLDVDVDVDVDVVGDSETSDWPTPPEPINCSNGDGSSRSNHMMVSSVVGGEAIDSSSIEIDSSVMVANCLSQGTGSVDGIVVGDSDCEFSLDLPPTPPSPLSNVVTESMDTTPTTTATIQVTGASIGTEARQMSSSSLEAEDVEDMTSSDTKENTCTFPLSSCCSSVTTTLIPSTIDRKCTDHHMSNHNSVVGPGGNPISNSLVSQPSDNASSINSSSSSTSSSSSSSSADKQYSSCGHSSIFGELQSVVFHSLIASLET